MHHNPLVISQLWNYRVRGSQPWYTGMPSWEPLSGASWETLSGASWEPLSGASWKNCWFFINKRSCEQYDEGLQGELYYVINTFRLHRQAFMADYSSSLQPKTNVIWNRWETHRDQIFVLITFPWAWDRVIKTLGLSAAEWTTESVHKALLAGTTFGHYEEDVPGVSLKQDEELKYVSVEMGHPERATVPMPRYSVEPINREALRGTDELVQGNARRTDELVEGNTRRADELVSGVGHHRHSEELAMHAIWDTSVWPSENSPRVKQEH